MFFNEKTIESFWYKNDLKRFTFFQNNLTKNSKSTFSNVTCDDPTATNKERQPYYLPNQQNDEPGN